MTTLRALLVALLVLGSFPAAGVIDLRRVAMNLTNPVLITHAGDARLFIVEQSGVIQVFPPGTLTPTVFLNISTRIAYSGERGLLGLAFHPGYATNGRFFVFYTRTGDGALVIAEYHVSASNPNVADMTETPILTIPHPTNANHNGGMIAFGPDGYLYIATGDGGSGNDPANNAQNIESLLGKILRIDVNTATPGTYLSPATNPFVGRAGRDEIYAWGLRNPWRFSFDAGNGNLIAGDVGQGAVEEVDFILNGQNYGWRVFEGTSCTNIDQQLCSGAGYTMPVLQYSHSGGRCSITGGYFYNGRRRAINDSWYFFGDFCTGEILVSSNPSGGQFSVELDTTFLLSSFGEDSVRELYVADHGGTVYRIVNSARNDFGNEIEPREMRDDLLWQNLRNGDIEVWFMVNNARVGGESLPRVADTNWRIRGTADFDGDGHVDILWRNQATGGNAVWLMTATAFREARTLPGVADPAWDLVGANDFNGDGFADLVWRNGSTGVNAIWLMQGLSVLAVRILPAAPDSNWRMVGLDDISGDGWNDILWYHLTSGGVAVWVMRGTTVETPTAIAGANNPSWRLQGVADINRDRRTDLLWRNQNTGENAVWFMNNLSVTGSALLPPMPNLDFQLVAPR